jgi:uncharacterized protein
MEAQDAKYWIERLDMQPHPEGGYYKEVFRSQQQVHRLNAEETKQACTSIYYLLEGNDFSGFHRLVSDEIWYFHVGAPVHIHSIDKEGKYQLHELSAAPTGHFSVVIPGGCWFAAEIPSQQQFSLVSCVVAPGFDFREFEMAKQQELMASYPHHREVITRLCRQ